MTWCTLSPDQSTSFLQRRRLWVIRRRRRRRRRSSSSSGNSSRRKRRRSRRKVYSGGETNFAYLWGETYSISNPFNSFE